MARCFRILTVPYMAEFGLGKHQRSLYYPFVSGWGEENIRVWNADQTFLPEILLD